MKRNPESFSSATSIVADARSRRAAMDRHGERFDDVARSLAALPTRRRFLGLALGGVLAAARLADAEARKRRKRKKSCGICEKKKKGKCKPRPDGLACGEGQVCRKGRCECQEKCGAGGECLANGTCATICPASGMCGEGCGCGLPSVAGPQYCVVNEGGCDVFLQGCESNAECPIGQACLTTFCATPPFTRCISLCDN